MRLIDRQSDRRAEGGRFRHRYRLLGLFQSRRAADHRHPRDRDAVAVAMTSTRGKRFNGSHVSKSAGLRGPVPNPSWHCRLYSSLVCSAAAFADDQIIIWLQVAFDRTATSRFRGDPLAREGQVGEGVRPIS